MRSLLVAIASVASVLWSATAAAAVGRAPDAPVFSGSVVSEAELSVARAGYAVGPRLTRNTFATMLDTQAHTDFRDSGSIARTTMDIWWGSTGIELIAGSVRGTTPQ